MDEKLKAAAAYEDSLKVEMALAVGREAQYRLSDIEKELSELKSNLEVIRAAVSKLVNDLRPKE